MRSTRRENIRVVVTPRQEGDFGWMSVSIGNPQSNSEHMRAEADRIVAEIRRHVDGIAGVGVIWETITVCGNDEYRIDAAGDSTRWWPECCTADQQEYFDLHAHESDEWFAEHKMSDPGYLQEFRDAVQIAETEEP